MKSDIGEEQRLPYAQIISRLDALIRLAAEGMYKKNNGGLKEGDVVRMLNAAGLTPSEIAKIMGKPGRTSITSMLYGRKKSKRLKTKKELTETSANGEQIAKSRNS